ncbi:MAG: hypothetical protein K2X39_04300, partial [Silvanigrellaceae bacterium]|nr:hypothetical protein [Silvanigrellaceae bacterium]
MINMFFLRLSLLIFVLQSCATNCTAKSDKWIVVTTINYPTAALKKLAKLPDWRLVVVGDKKTPKDWHLDNCVFLDVEMQAKLPY